MLILRVIAVSLCMCVASSVFAQPALNTNILANPGFETDDANHGGWQVETGGFNLAGWSPPGPHSGSSYFYAGNNNYTEIYQEFDLAARGYDSFRLSTGGYQVSYGGWQACWEEWIGPWDGGQVYLIQRNSSGTVIDSGGLGEQAPGSSWAQIVSARQLAPGTTSVRFQFSASHRDTVGGNNDAHFDDAELKLSEYDIWTWGGNSSGADYQANGNWNPPSNTTFGLQGTGGVGVSDYRTLTTSSTTTLGYGHDANGIVRVTDNGTWNSTGGYVDIGNFGHGSVTIENGGTWNAQNISIGVYDEHDRTNYVNINAGGTLTSDSVGLGSIGAKGTANIRGGTWIANGQVSVGSYGASGIVNVSDNGQWTTHDLVKLSNYYIGDTTGTVNLGYGTWSANAPVHIGTQSAGTVNITDDWALWDTHDDVYVGGFDAPNTTSERGDVNFSAGQWNAHDTVHIGGATPGSVNITGGEMVLGSSANVDLRANGTLLLDGGSITTFGSKDLSSLSKFDFVNGTFAMSSGTYTGFDRSFGPGCFVELNESSSAAIWQVEEINFGVGSRLTMTGSTLEVLDGGLANFFSPIAFVGTGNTIQLDNGRLGHFASSLELAGNSIAGHGDVLLGSAGVDLGTMDLPGSLIGTSDTERLNVFGGVSGCGEIVNANIYGDLDVGNSPGEVLLSDVTFGASSEILMEIAGLSSSEFDRIVLGDDVDFAGALIEIYFADGFVPGADDSFGLFTAVRGGSIYDALATADITTPDGWFLDMTTGVMTVPEPSSVVILALAGLSLIGRRRF